MSLSIDERRVKGHKSIMGNNEPHEPQPHLGPQAELRTQREQFQTHELATVLSYFNIGVIEQIREYRRGSRRAPKLRIKSKNGHYLLKRRAPGRDDPYRVAFAHSLQIVLAENKYPVPGFVGTHETNNSLLQLNGRIYELFRYVKGDRYDKSVAQTHDAGRALGALHRLLSDFKPQYDPPVGAYHAMPGIDARLTQIPEMVANAEPNVDNKALKETCIFIQKAYSNAARKVEKLGYRTWPSTVVHGDWHPGNLLFKDGIVVAVLDFDSARLECAAADVANGALQFSMKMSWPDDPNTWPKGLDSERIRAILRGYHETAERNLTDEEIAALPWLMIEALVMESVVPIAATGSFGRIAGSTFLNMVERECRWLISRADKLVKFLED